MKNYYVSYYLDKMYHNYIVEAENEVAAIQKVLRGLYSPEIFHDFKIERCYPEWN